MCCNGIQHRIPGAGRNIFCVKKISGNDNRLHSVIRTIRNHTEKRLKYLVFPLFCLFAAQIRGHFRIQMYVRTVNDFHRNPSPLYSVNSNITVLLSDSFILLIICATGNHKLYIFAKRSREADSQETGGEARHQNPGIICKNTEKMIE